MKDEFEWERYPYRQALIVEPDCQPPGYVVADILRKLVIRLDLETRILSRDIYENGVFSGHGIVLLSAASHQYRDLMIGLEERIYAYRVELIDQRCEGMKRMDKHPGLIAEFADTPESLATRAMEHAAHAAVDRQAAFKAFQECRRKWETDTHSILLELG